MVRTLIFLIVVVLAAGAQTPDPAYQPLEKAYEALRAKNYDDAISSFERAIALAPQRASIHKDLAYTLLKVGSNDAALDQFAAAMRLDPADQHVALEYAFLCYETKQQVTARRVFDRIRKTGNATAEAAFQNIDKPLADGIARWQKALEMSPDNFSAHEELAKLAEQRDELSLAAEHYEKAWRIKPEERSLAARSRPRLETAGPAGRRHRRPACGFPGHTAPRLRTSPGAAALALSICIRISERHSSRSQERRTAPRTRLPQLEMGNKQEAEAQFKAIHQLAPDDLLSTAQLGFLLLNRHEIVAAQPLLDQVLKSGDPELADRVAPR